MGTGSSRDLPITYDEARYKAGTEKLNRLNDTFNRLSSNNYYLPQVTFMRDVLGDNVPTKLAEALYHTFGGGSKGISFKDTLCGLILLTEGTKEQKASLIAQMLSDGQPYIQKERLVDFVKACDSAGPRHDLTSLFPESSQHPECTVEDFTRWIQTNYKMASFSQWLLDDNNRAFTLGGEEKDPPTIHQTLAQQYGLDQQDVMCVEKIYWSLRGADKCNLKTFEQYASPPLPKELCASLFRVFDNNCDGHIDLEEMIRGVAQCCCRTEEERHKLCFQMFDDDQDGTLNKAELTRALGFLKEIDSVEVEPTAQLATSSTNNPVVSSTNVTTSVPNIIVSEPSGGVSVSSPQTSEPSEGGASVSNPQTSEPSVGGAAVSSPQTSVTSGSPDVPGVSHTPSNDPQSGTGSADVVSAGTQPDPGYDAEAIFQYYKRLDGHLTEQDYVHWASGHNQASELLDLLVQICHIRFGIRPKDSQVEGMVVGGYLRRFKKRGLHPGDTVYLLSAMWFKSWCEYTGYQSGDITGSAASPGSSQKREKKSKQKKAKQSKGQNRATSPSLQSNGSGPHELQELEIAAEAKSLEPSLSGSEHEAAKKPGPIDNSALCQPDILDGQKKLPSLTSEGGCLKHELSLKEGVDFVHLPEEIWKVFTSWYGTAETTYYGPPLPRKVDGNGEIEYHPVLFKVYRHSNSPLHKPGGVWQSIQMLFGFGGAATPRASPRHGDDDIPGAVTPPPPKRTLYYQATFSKKATIKEISERMQQLLHLRADEIRIHDLTDIDQPHLLDDENKTVENLQFQDFQKILVETRNKDNTWPEEMIVLVRELNAKGGKIEPQPQTQSHDAVPGAVGLGNLGNTCFMNSALQCVSNTQPLTKYFRDRQYVREINKENPLGRKGVIAKKYAELIDGLWNTNAKSITPLRFRFTVAKYAAQFEGYNQQDAQELLAFVLDGLHEDLNRVKVKPYMELKDSDGRDDQVVADEEWDYHCKRNNSIIVDLFQGQLKSVVRCRECGYQSVRFDPFTFLSLPLSFESTVGLEVIVVRLDSSQPVRYGIKVELDSTYVALKEKLAHLVSIPQQRIHLVEVSSCTVKGTLQDTTKIRSVLAGWLYAYEIPEPPPVQPTPRSDSPDEQARVSKVQHLKYERTMSMNQSKNLQEKAKAARARRDEKELQEEGDSAQDGSETSVPEDKVATSKEGVEPCVAEEKSAAPVGGAESLKLPVPVTPVPEICVHEEEGLSVPSSPDPASVEAAASGGVSTSPPPLSVGATPTGAVETVSDATSRPEQTIPSSTTTVIHSPPPLVNIVNSGCVFAVHRRTYVISQYFVSCNKIKKALFGTPLLVPCHVGTPHRQIYEVVWQRCQRLLIPDPPNAKTRATSGYPFKLVKVHRDGLACDSCPWYRFCQGCPIDCDDHPMGTGVSLIGIDWDITTLNLKYQQALERPIDHESLASLKTMDVADIDLATCFKSFVREDNLGDDEKWYCKRCQKQQLATKSLEIWRLPPILIIHLKRFQFFNGHWIKSQQQVKFPMEGMNPMEYNRTVERKHPGSSTVDVVEVAAAVSAPVDGTQIQAVCEVAVEAIPEEDAPKAAGHVDDVKSKAEDMFGKKEEQQMNGVCDLKTDRASNGQEAKVSVEMVNLAADNQHGTGTIEPLGVEPSKEGMLGGEAKGASETTEHDGDSRTNGIYDLFAVSIHAGVLGGGHYTSVAKNPNGKWYYYNDSSCKETTAERVSQECPYMLFYERRGLDYSKYQARHEGEDIGNPDDEKDEENEKASCVVS